VHVMAKGAYRATSRYYAVLDFLDTLEVSWSESPGQELGNLRAGSVLRRRRRIPVERAAWFSACSMLELADLASRQAYPDPRLFDRLEEGLDELETGTAAADAVLVAFELSFLDLLGLVPALEACAACGGPAPPTSATSSRAAFSAESGGRLCPRCAADARRSGRRVGTLPLVTLADARALLERGASSAEGLAQERIDKARDFAGRFLDYHLETRPRTHRAFLAAPNRNAPRGAAKAI
jgi:DNA repair protein RecO (recombination protein O)